MQDSKTLVNNLNLSYQQSNKQSNGSDREAETEARHMEVMDELWFKMIEIYSNKWTGGYGNEPTETWTQGLQKINPVRICIAAHKCIGNGIGWPPSLPEFVALTKFDPREIGAPDVETAFLFACDSCYNRTVVKKWGHPAIYQTVRELESFRHMDNKTKRSKFETKYLEVIDRIGNGEQITIPKLLEHDKNPSGVITKSNKDTAKNTLAQLKEGLK